MRRFLNVLASVLLALLLVLRRELTAWFQGDRSHAQRLRMLFTPTLLVLFTLLLVGAWALVDAGYSAVALLLLTHVALLLDAAWRRRPPR
jgi:hypothetical protein